jgi:rhamnosyltransferase
MLFRNAVRLMRRGYVPLVWKFWAAIKLLLTACVHLFLDARRWEQLRCMSKGVWAGLRAQGTPVRT